MKGSKQAVIALQNIQSFNHNAELRILKGSVLLTEAGNLIDYVLKAGQSWKVKRGAKVVVEPLEQGTCLEHKMLGSKPTDEFKNWVFVENWGLVRLSK
jgi:hypothetical protein